MTADRLGLDLYDDDEGREYRRQHASLIRCDSVTRTEVRKLPDGSTQVRWPDGTTDMID
jgi:hypothetical protein